MHLTAYGLLYFHVDVTYNAFFFSSEAPLPADHKIVSVRCLGNGSASVSYNLGDSGYMCPGDTANIQVDYVCYSKDSQSSCTVSRVSS